MYKYVTRHLAKQKIERKQRNIGSVACKRIRLVTTRTLGFLLRWTFEGSAVHSGSLNHEAITASPSNYKTRLPRGRAM